MVRRTPYYRAHDFRRAIRTASARFDRPDALDTVQLAVSLGSMALLAAIWFCDWVFGFDAGRAIGIGLDPVPVLLAAMMAAFLFRVVRAHGRHARIINRRRCLDCGTELRDQPVDANGDGTCPHFRGEFNLIEYRHPDDVLGRAFTGYVSPRHCRRVLFRAAQRIHKARGATFEQALLVYGWAAMGATVVLMAVLETWELEAWRSSGWLFFWGSVALSIWGAIYLARMYRLRSMIIGERLCFDCGYSLEAAPTDGDGIGRCPECHAEFSLAQYERPRAGRPI